MELCRICPRKCNIDRSQDTGFCREGDLMRISRIAPHYYEEPPISYKNGSGTVFFSGCNLHCVFCQNKNISQGERIGKEYSQDELIDAIVALQESGVHNINLVTPTHFAKQIAKLLTKMKKEDLLCVPVVYNSSGYESIDTLKMLDGLIDIYMPDIKYFSSELSAKYSAAPDYFDVASRAIVEMLRQRGHYRYNEQESGLLSSGVIIRHLVLPSHRKDSIDALTHLAELIDPSDVLISIMSQYTPDFALDTPYTELHRRITTFEYNSVCNTATALGFDGFMQARSSASSVYTPEFGS
jgi:putative pyruvate formate lyase activating enzyme